MADNLYDAQIIVCVTAQLECQRLIKIGQQLASQTGDPVQVLSVQPVNQEAEQRAQALGSLYEIAKAAGAEIAIYYNDSPAIVTATHATRCHAKELITGFPEQGTSNHFVDMVRMLAPDIRITMVDKNNRLHVMEPSAIGCAKR